MPWGKALRGWLSRKKKKEQAREVKRSRGQKVKRKVAVVADVSVEKKKRNSQISIIAIPAAGFVPLPIARVTRESEPPLLNAFSRT